MALQVWLPLNGNLNNQGLSNVTVTNNGATIDNSGKIGKCYSFGTNSSYLTLSNDSMNTFTTECSVSFWINILSWNTNWATIFQAGLPSTPWTSYRFGILRSSSNTNLCFAISDGSTSSQQSYTTPNLSINTWYHFVFIYKTGHCLIYVNGNLYQDYTTNIVPSFNTISKITIGKCADGSSYQSNIKLNDFRIYNHCLSPKEVELISRGLVVHYPLNDTAIESTTNLGNYLNDAFDGVTQKYRFGENTNIYKDDGVFQNRQCSKVRIGSAGQTIHPYVSFPNLHPAQNTYKTVSFDYYPTSVNTIQFYSWSGSATAIYQVNNGPVTSGSTIPVNLNQWNHIRLTLYGTSDKTGGWGWMKIGTSPITSTTSDYWLFANIQVEAKDHETAYTDTTRANNIIYDTSGYNNHGIINGTVECNTDTPRYSVCTDFNKSGYIIKDAFNTYTHQFTFNIWVNPKSISSQHFLFGTFTSWTKNGIGIWRDSGYSHYSWLIKSDSESSYSSSNLTYTLNTWNMLTLVYTGVNLLGYVNGIQQFNSTYGSGGVVNNPVFMIANSKYNNTPASENEEAYISDVRFYATALTADQIKELYQTSASIDKNGNMYAYEYNEV